MCLIGLLEGAAYYIGWKFLHGKPFKLFGLTIATGGTEYGELITGALYGVMFSLLT